MTPLLTDDQLDALLAGSGPLEDDGFTSRVMEALPPPRRRPRIAIMLAATIGGIAAATAAGQLPMSVAEALSRGPVGWALAALLLGGAVAAVAGTAVGVARAES